MSSSNLLKLDVRRLVIAQATSTFGDNLSTFASFAAIYHNTGSPIQASLSLLVKAVVQISIGFLSMGFLDRVSDRKVLLISDLVRMFLIGLLAVTPQLSTFQILSTIAACTTIEVVFSASRDALFTAKISSLTDSEKDRYVASDNLWRSIMEASGCLAFAMAITMDYRLAFGLDAITFLVSAAFVFRILDPARLVHDGSMFSMEAFMGGIRPVFQLPPLLRSTIARVFFFLGAGIFNMMLLKVAQEYFSHQSPVAIVAWWDFAIATGMIVGSRIVARIAKYCPLFVLCFCGNLIVGLGIIAFWIFPQMGVVSAVMFIAGIGMTLAGFSVRRIRQDVTPVESRARVMAFTNLIARVGEISGMTLVLVLGTFAQTYIFASSAMFVLAALVAASGFVGSVGFRRRYNVGS